ncbi:hypothetical protein VDGD_20480 [Verticillium dahliae]|nr:hypothetical protein VDGD_20480 [Verticillium dahliae]
MRTEDEDLAVLSVRLDGIRRREGFQTKAFCLGWLDAAEEAEADV